MSIVKNFNKVLMQFVDEILVVFPKDRQVKLGKMVLIGIKKVNPSLLIRYWYDCIYVPYYPEIEKGNIDYFIEKDYSEDMKIFKDPKYFMKAIDKFRQPIREMDYENKHKALIYVQTLCKMSFVYKQNKGSK
tara:strand:- start:515 stop:910 length:396 start_codon:yes stop_codon:yes gene_type:complete